MAALNDHWQAARQLRQSAVANRREHVAAELLYYRQERRACGDQLRQNLTQTVTALQAETNQWLAQRTEQRIDQIPQLRQTLQSYTEQLQAKTQVLLASYQASRHFKGMAQRQQLGQDRQELKEVVNDLHLSFIQDLREIQRQVWAIQEQVAVERSGYRQHQVLVIARLWPELTSYVAELQTEVEATLISLTEARQKAEASRLRQRQHERLALSACVDELFDKLSEFRHQLQLQRSQLTFQVWGTKPAIPEVVQIAQAVPKVAAKSEPRSIAGLTAPGAQSTSLASQPAAHFVPAASTAPTARPMPLARPAIDRPTPQAPGSGAQSLAAPMVAVATVASSPQPSQSQPLEDVVYNYLHLANGAHLNEIESELGINRFQAVDALRSLIQRNLIVKHDRTYRIQEEAVL